MRTMTLETIPAGSNAMATINGPAISADRYTRISAQAVVDGDASIVGTLSIQVSNDKAPTGTAVANFTPTNWTTLGTATTITGPGNAFAQSVSLCAAWARAVWTYTSGTGASTVQVTVVMLGMGGQ
jgi:hypothetical protein